ncbi:MAG: hypothetical protein AAGN66_01380 [Acidobacteriota bacterium]
MTVAHDLASVDVLDTSGNPVPLGTFWSDRPAAVVFVRHYG